MKHLREVRIEKLHTAKTLAAAAGVSDKTIFAIERGESVPGVRTIKKLSDALGVQPSEITEFAAAIAELSKKTTATAGQRE